MSAFVKLYKKIYKNNKQCDICVCMGGSYLCSPHGRCTFWQSWALMCSPADTDWSDCSQTPDLWAHTNIYFHLSPVWWNITEDSLESRALLTFNISFVSDSLVCGSTSQELLELHPGFLLVWWIHAHRILHCCRKTGSMWVDLFANTLNVHSAAQGHSQTYLGSS